MQCLKLSKNEAQIGGGYAAIVISTAAIGEPMYTEMSYVLMSFE